MINSCWMGRPSAACIAGMPAEKPPTAGPEKLGHYEIPGQGQRDELRCQHHHQARRMSVDERLAGADAATP